MALNKEITESNGVVTTYHRIAMVKIDTNQENTILIHSYLSESARQIEKDYASGVYENIEEGGMNWPYVSSRYITCDYNEAMTIPNAYSYLKTLPEFEGATDV